MNENRHFLNDVDTDTIPSFSADADTITSLSVDFDIFKKYR